MRRAWHRGPELERTFEGLAGASDLSSSSSNNSLLSLVSQTRYDQLIANTQLKPLAAILNYISFGITCCFLKNTEVPPTLSAALELEGSNIAVLILSVPSQSSVSVEVTESSMDVDEDSISAISKSTPKGKTSLNEVGAGPSQGRPTKRPHGEPDVAVEHREVETVTKRKKKTGKEKIKDIFADLGNFMTEGDVEVIQEVDNSIAPIDLSEETVTALTAVDFVMVLFLEHKVRCRYLDLSILTVLLVLRRMLLPPGRLFSGVEVV